ncbi:MAG: DUF4105 domain-containing protein [Myxococcaceae bacterium]
MIAAAALVVASAIAAQATPESVAALSRCGIVLDESASSVADEFSAALSKLPAALCRGPEVHVRLDDKAAPFGMDEETRAPSEFQLHFFEDAADERAQWPLKALDSKRRERLWRARSLVHLLVTRWDNTARASASPRWRAVAHWERFPFERALNSDPFSFSRAAGSRSAQLDLVTTAEELFVRPGSDDQPACRALAKARFFAEQFNLPELARCASFESHADPGTVTGFEVLYSVPSAARPESLFGHLFLWVRRDGDRAPGEVIEIGAVVPPDDSMVRKISAGLAGGYLSAFEARPLQDVLREHNESDQRDLRRYALNLTPTERGRLLEEIFDVERSGYFPYFFFSQNCASLLELLVRGALDERRRVDAGLALAESPTQVLDALARTPGVDGGPPLLDPVREEFESGRSRAFQAGLRRDEASELIAASLKEPFASEWRTLSARLDSTEVALRKQALSLLRSKARSFGAASPEAWRTFADATVDIERYASERTSHDAQQREVKRLERSPAMKSLPSHDELIAHRRAVYRTNPDDADVQMASYFAQLKRKVVAAAGPPDEDECHAKELAAAQHGLYLDAVRLRADASNDPRATADPRMHENDASDDLDKVAQRADPNAAPLSGSGLGRLGATFGVTAFAEGGAQPTVTLRSSLWRQELGESLSRGGRPNVALRVADIEAQLLNNGGILTLDRATLTALRLQTVPLEPWAAKDRLSSIVGLFAEASWDFRRRGPFQTESVASAGITLPLSLRNWPGGFAVASLGGSAYGSGLFSASALSAGPRAELSLRLDPFVLRAEYAFRRTVLGTTPKGWLGQGRADASLRFRVVNGGAWAALLGPELSLFADPGVASPQVTASVALEIL